MWLAPAVLRRGSATLNDEVMGSSCTTFLLRDVNCGFQTQRVQADACTSPTTGLARASVEAAHRRPEARRLALQEAIQDDGRFTLQ